MKAWMFRRNYANLYGTMRDNQFSDLRFDFVHYIEKEVTAARQKIFAKCFFDQFENADKLLKQYSTFIEERNRLPKRW